MKNKTYHHGDLKCALMEKGLELISKYGEDKLSLRRLAAECGVSNAAPYAHFKNKDEFLSEIQNYVMNLFALELQKALQENAHSDKLFIKLGTAYVMFFHRNPLYFDFLFSRKNIEVQLSLNENSTNIPFEILKKTAYVYFSEFEMSEREIENKIMAMWSLVHGLSSVAAVLNLKSNEEFEARTEEILGAAVISRQGG